MVSIITVNYNGWKDTCELITSLKEYETFSDYEVIVVDNASAGNDVNEIKMAHPDVIVVQSKENRGFAGGNNLGYWYARGEYLFFLNNDMIIKAPMLASLVRRLQDKSIGGVTPCIYFLYKPDWMQYYGYRDMTSITLRHTTESYDPFRRSDFMHPKETEVLHGAAMMVRCDVIEQVGVMTEDYFLFYEEFDWSKRIRAAGYKLFYEPASVIYHKESMTIKPLNPTREYYLTRARMIYARRNCKGGDKPLACAYQLLIAVPKKLITYLLKGRGDLARAVCKGVFSGLFLRLHP